MKKLLFAFTVAGCFLAACNSKTKLSGTTGDNEIDLLKNKKTAMHAEMAFIAKDVEGVFKDCDTNFVEYGTGEGEPIKKIDRLKAGLREFYEAYTNIEGENMHALADSNMVIVTVHWSATFAHPFMGLKPTKKRYKVFDADIFTFNPNGKIASHKSVQSNLTYLYQEGAPLPPRKK